MPGRGFFSRTRSIDSMTRSEAYARLFKPVHLDGVSHHTFRHTGASNMLRDGASARAVQTDRMMDDAAAGRTLLPRHRCRTTQSRRAREQTSAGQRAGTVGETAIEVPNPRTSEQPNLSVSWKLASPAGCARVGAPETFIEGEVAA